MDDPGYECLSIVELADVLAGAALPAEDQEHLERCGRCRALMHQYTDTEAIGLTFDSREIGGPMMQTPPHPEQMRTGQLWLTQGFDADWSEVVAIIGRTPDNAEHLLVAPVVAEPTLATERDLLLDGELLGYPSFVDIGNAGVVVKSSLREFRGHLDEGDSRALVSLYKAMMGAEVAPIQGRTGAPVASSDDPRLLASNLRAERFSALWREAFKTVDAVERHGQEANNEATGYATLGELLTSQLNGPEWDRGSLLEASAVEPASLDKFIANKLDLTDQRDVPDLAAILQLLVEEPSEALPAVEATLQQGAGGMRYAVQTHLRAAARSRPGTSADEVTKDRFRSTSKVDKSSEAREKEIASYLAELHRILEDLS